MDAHPVHQQQLSSLFRRRRARSKRASSFDRTGANADFLRIEGGETAVLMEADGPGCITHTYCALVLPDIREYRNAVLRYFWDGSDRPSVEVPLGDFFALPHARTRDIKSVFVAVNGGLGTSFGLNAYFPMPFSDGVRVTLENRGARPLGGPLGAFWYHIEYETYDDALPDDTLRFHACYRQERPTTAEGEAPNVTLHAAPNTDGASNYVALDTTGEGRMVGLHLQIDNVQGERWYGEGDDMVFIDGEAWPPSIHGTGSEEIFGGGACPAYEYAGPYTGFHLIESRAYDGLVGMYRWYVHDPIHFSRSLRWTIEHGHANNFANDYCSVAYWYQTPAALLPDLPAAQDMQPPLSDAYDEALQMVWETAASSMGSPDGPGRFLAVAQRGEPLYRGDFAAAIEAMRAIKEGA